MSRLTVMRIVVVQEYAPPKTVDPNKARQRLFDVIARHWPCWSYRRIS
ncbi:hypothetical protein ACNKHW_06060 [Shigella flexneri]